MKYIESKMSHLVKDHPDLQKKLKSIMKEMELEKKFALKALYHSEVAEGGKYQNDYQNL